MLKERARGSEDLQHTRLLQHLVLIHIAVLGPGGSLQAFAMATFTLPLAVVCRFEKQMAEQELDRLEEDTRKKADKKKLQEEAGTLDPRQQMEQAIG